MLPLHVHPHCGIIIQRWLWPSALLIAIITDTTACSKVSALSDGSKRKIDPAFRSSQKVCGVIFGIWKVYKTATRAAARALTRWLLDVVISILLYNATLPPLPPSSFSPHYRAAMLSLAHSLARRSIYAFKSGRRFLDLRNPG